MIVGVDERLPLSAHAQRTGESAERQKLEHDEDGTRRQSRELCRFDSLSFHDGEPLSLLLSTMLLLPWCFLRQTSVRVRYFCHEVGTQRRRRSVLRPNVKCISAKNFLRFAKRDLRDQKL